MKKIINNWKIKIPTQHIQRKLPWINFVLGLLLAFYISALASSFIANKFFYSDKSQKTIATSPSIKISPTSVPSPTDTEFKTVETNKNTQKTKVNTKDPITTCNFTYLPPKQMLQSQCQITFECQIKNQWILYTSREQCSKDQQSTNNQQAQQTNTATSQTTQYPPCTINYPYTSSSTYNGMSPEWCKSEQERVNGISQIGANNTSTTSQEEPQQTNNSQVQQCQSEVTNKYQGLFQSCNSHGGSTRDACIQIYEQQRQQEYNACG